MPTTSERPYKVPAKPRAKRLVKTSSVSPQPFLRFYHSQSLRAKTLSVLTALENAEDSTVHREALAGIIVELTDCGMEYYFLKPLKLAKVGFFVQQSASFGMSATTGVLASVIRNIISNMDSAQLLMVCSYIRQSKSCKRIDSYTGFASESQTSQVRWFAALYDPTALHS